MSTDEKQVEHLWSILTGNHPDAHSYDADEVADKLARFGETTATIVLRDVRAAVQFTHDHFEENGFRDDEHGEPEQNRESLLDELEYGLEDADEESDLSWREPWLDDDRLGGPVNVFRIRIMLEKIGGSAAQRAVSLLRLMDDPLDAVSPKDVSSWAAVLTGRDAEAALIAVYALEKLGPEAVAPLSAVLMPEATVDIAHVSDTVHELWVKAAWALGRIGDRRALDTLVDVIGKYDEYTSEAAIEAVVALGGDARAVLPTLQASLPVEDNDKHWNFDGRIEAILKMGPQSFDALVAAAADPDSETRSLALRAITEAIKTASADEERTRQAEGAAACGVAGLTDHEASVRVAAMKLLCTLNIPDLANHLVPLLGDTNEDEFHWSYEDGSQFTVGMIAADAFPDDDAALESLRLALADGRLDPVNAWLSLLDVNDYDKQKHGSARHAETVVAFVLEAAKRTDEDNEDSDNVLDALSWAATKQALERLGQNYLDDAEEILSAQEARQSTPDAF